MIDRSQPRNPGAETTSRTLPGASGERASRPSKPPRGVLRRIARVLLVGLGSSIAALALLLAALTGWPPTPRRIGAAISAGIHSRFIFRGPEATWWGDLVRTAWVRGDRAYIALGTRIGVLDISDPASPRLLTALPAGGIVHGFAASGDILYIAHGVNGLSSWDVTDLDHPVRLGFFTSDGYGMGVAVLERYVVYSAGLDGWWVLDVSDPRDPRPVFHDPEGNASAATLDHGLLYLADGTRGVVIWDFHDPAHPVKLAAVDTTIRQGLVPLDPAPLWIAVGDGVAYVANGPDGVVVLDVSDPKSPRQTAHVPLHGYAYTVMLDGDRAYVADIGRGLVTLDTSDPRAPREFATTRTPGGAFDLVRQGRTLYLSDGAGGFMILDLTDRDRPKQIGYFPMAGQTRSVLLDGNRLIASRGSLGIAVYDVSEPRSPALRAVVDTPGLVNDVTAHGDRIYAADFIGGVQVIEPDTGGALRISSTFNIENHPLGLAVDDQHLFMANAHYGFMEFDVSGEPVLTGQDQSLGGYSVGLTRSGSRVLLSNLVKGIGLLDVADPARPRLTAIYPPPRSAAHQLAFGLPTVIRTRIRGDHAFLAAYSNGLQIVSLRDPNAIEPVGRLSTGGYVYGLDLDGDTAYLTDYEGRLIAADISDLARPSVKRVYRMPAGEAWNVAVRGRIAYVALGSAGLGVVDLDTGETRVLDHVH